MNSRLEDSEIMVLFTITSYSQSKQVEKLFSKYNLPVNLLCHGNGTAISELLDYLGLEDTKKLISISLIKKEQVNGIYKLFNKVLNFDAQGTGIAFTLPLTSISSRLSILINSHENKLDDESEEFHMANPYELIFTIVSSGYFNQVMDAAKSAGAKGGTVIHAKGLGSDEAVKFLGITIQPEKDVVLILSSKERKHKIMEEISHKAGLSTPGRGICFSIPVTSALGLNADLDDFNMQKEQL